MLNHLGFFFFFAFFFCFFFPKVRVGAKEGGSHYWEMAVAITCGYGGYLLPLLAAHSSLNSRFCHNCYQTLTFFLFSWQEMHSTHIEWWGWCGVGGWGWVGCMRRYGGKQLPLLLPQTPSESKFTLSKHCHKSKFAYMKLVCGYWLNWISIPS